MNLGPCWQVKADEFNFNACAVCTGHKRTERARHLRLPKMPLAPLASLLLGSKQNSRLWACFFTLAELTCIFCLLIFNGQIFCSSANKLTDISTVNDNEYLHNFKICLIQCNQIIFMLRLFGSILFFF